MAGKLIVAVALAVAVVLVDALVDAQGPRGQFDEVVVLDNDSLRAILFTYRPGADSDMHLNPGPEITIVREGELALYTSKGREALGPGTVHWLPTSTIHLARNEGESPAIFWSLLIKRCE